jgi:hypothetical protein
MGLTITDNGEEKEEIQERIAKRTNGWEDCFIIKIKEYLKKYEKKGSYPIFSCFLVIA